MRNAPPPSTNGRLVTFRSTVSVPCSKYWGNVCVSLNGLALDCSPPFKVSRMRSPGLEGADVRSEEHTSELQSQSNLVCRLLLEKKKLLVRIILKFTSPETI